MGFAFVSVAATVTGMLAWVFGIAVTPLVAKLANSGHHLAQVLGARQARCATATLK